MSVKEDIGLDKTKSVRTSIAPWLSIPSAARAIEFYKAAFSAVEVYRLEMPDGGLVARLSVNDSEFWISGGIKVNDEVPALPLGGETVRMILTVADPEIVFTSALKAGATEIFPVGEEHGWKLGRLVDPFGLHWEIGHEVSNY